MKPVRWGMMWALVAWCAGGFCGRDAAAQSLGDPLGSAGAAGLGAASSSGSAVTPTPFPLFTPTVPSVTADPTAPAVGSSAQGGLMSSPFAAPFMYSSMFQATQPLSMSSSSTTGTTTGTTTGAGRGMGMNTANLGLLMLMTQRNPGGVGSGQYTGLGRSSPAQSTAARTPATAKRRRPPGPAGSPPAISTASIRTRLIRRRYFNRQSRYFP